jgi:hypothetical protein
MLPFAMAILDLTLRLSPRIFSSFLIVCFLEDAINALAYFCVTAYVAS